MCVLIAVLAMSLFETPETETTEKVFMNVLAAPSVESSFLEEEAGISAYTNVGNIDLNKVKGVFKTIEKETDEYIVGSIELPSIDKDYYVHGYVQKDGLIVVYYMKEDPASKILGVTDSSIRENDENLKIALNSVSIALGVITKDIKYYDFRYPTANKMMKIIGKDFRFKVQSGIVVYEASFMNERRYGCASFGGGCSGYIEFDGGRLSTDKYGKIDILKVTHDEFHNIQGVSMKVGVILIYHEP